MSFLDSVPQAGGFRGWPVRAIIAIQNGASPAEVKRSLIATLDERIRQDTAEIERIRALPDRVVLE